MPDKQIRPPYEIVLQADHIKRLEEELKAKEQECEELKDKIKFTEGYIETVENARDELEKKLEKIKEIAVTNIQSDQCSNCDGVGLGECGDTNCSYYQMYRVLKIIEE